MSIAGQQLILLFRSRSCSFNVSFGLSLFGPRPVNGTWDARISVEELATRITAARAEQTTRECGAPKHMIARSESAWPRVCRQRIIIVL